jgi:hypothetical protein
MILCPPERLPSEAEATDLEHERASSPQSEPSASPEMLCNLTGGNAFCESYSNPHLPILAAFGADRLHACRLSGAWDLDRAVSDNRTALVRSIRNVVQKKAAIEWDDLTFQFGPRAFLYADVSRVVAFANTPTEAQNLVQQFKAKYEKPPEPCGGSFYLIKLNDSTISCQDVPLAADSTLDDERLALHYGRESVDWHRELLAKLRNNKHGLAIFEGAPGTGKNVLLAPPDGRAQRHAPILLYSAVDDWSPLAT